MVKQKQFNEMNVSFSIDGKNIRPMHRFKKKIDVQTIIYVHGKRTIVDWYFYFYYDLHFFYFAYAENVYIFCRYRIYVPFYGIEINDW